MVRYVKERDVRKTLTKPKAIELMEQGRRPQPVIEKLPAKRSLDQYFYEYADRQIFHGCCPRLIACVRASVACATKGTAVSGKGDTLLTFISHNT